MGVVVGGLGWAVLTPIAMERPWLAVPPLVGIVLLSVVGLAVLDRFPAKRWRVLGAVLFLVACADLYLVNAWWDAIPAMWMGITTGKETVRPLMVNCVLVAFIGAGALLFLQQRPTGKRSGGQEQSAERPPSSPEEVPLG